MSDVQTAVRARTETRLAVEEFVYREAFLLDAWRLEEWIGLFTEDCRYEVTPTSSEDPWNIERHTTLFLIGDNRERLEQRVIRLGKKTAHVEFPKSKTRHLYTNVLVEADDGETVTAFANFCTFRTKNKITTQYPGSMRYLLSRTPDGFKIKAKRVVLDLEALIPQGKVSIIL